MKTFASAVLALALLGGCGGYEEGAKSVSAFSVDADGWTIVGDAQSSSVKPDYSGTGGNPDGLISAKDDVTGGVWYFQAPDKYLGDNSATVGKVLKYDLKVTPIDNPFDDIDVVLEGGGKRLAFDTSPAPGTDWTTFKVPLTASAGWKVGTLSGAAATDDELKAVLGNLTLLRIRGEFNTGPDTGSLDNVKFGANP